MGNTSTLVSSDNKGFAAHAVEAHRSPGFVAAFAQSNEGDVSPNLWGPPDGTHDLLRMRTIGGRQAECAERLLASASTPLTGLVRCGVMHVNFAGIHLRPQYHQYAAGPLGTPDHTSSATYGAGVIKGAPADGPVDDYGAASFVEMMAQRSPDQGEKSVLVDLGALNAVPEVLPLQVWRPRRTVEYSSMASIAET